MMTVLPFLTNEGGIVLKAISDHTVLIIAAMFAFTVALTVLMVWARSAEKKYNSGQQTADKHIKSTRIIAINGVTPNISGKVLRGMIVGGMLAGEYGALYGALNASRHSADINEFTFLVKYDNSIKKTEKVREDSPRFKFLISKLED